MKSFRLTIAALAAAALTATASTAAPSVFAQAEPEPAAPALPEAVDAEPATPESVQSAPDSTITGPSESEIEADAATFGAVETDQTPYILVAQPTSRLGGNQRYGLMIIEQKKPDPLCYSTTGSSPTQVDILLLNFDFSGICGKSTDTNGYAIRVAGQDLSYDPVVENKNGVLVLSAIPRRSAGQNAQSFTIGQTDGIAANGFTKITMLPGWRLTRRTYQDKPTGLTYLTNDSTVAQLVEQSGGQVIAQPPTTPTTPPVVTPPTTPTAPATNFPDVAGDTYANEINRAVQLGFISGFPEDNTFRPQASLTREQVVSIVLDALGESPTAAATSKPFPDVDANRWSAAKIQKAASLGFVEGYPNGTFRPTQEVTRAELMAIMLKASQAHTGLTTLPVNGPGQTITDVNNHWSLQAVAKLSQFCEIATPLNEVGTNFAPDTPAKRNYAAAAMVRLLDCAQINSASGTTGQ